ncbi:geranylgeranylglycerol-phosphate geranylgeranyltransferase [Arachidicoccus sp.]|uniref:geranylgeranylglycerol-phosphate geranylgeranyltransferase n=1 Tax=Arachidicoccus sp. TaxID=1872624 RepID=UPI003D22D3D8
MRAFLRLIRWPNLIFIFLTQLLFEYCIILPAFNQAHTVPNLGGVYIFLLALSSMLVAAGGNIINDYFDVNIDQINKPEKIIIGKYIHRHWAILFHTLFSGFGIALGFWIDYKAHTYLLGFTNFLCVTLLFIYSMVLKRKPLSGNVVIALLTAWTVLVVTFGESSQLIKLGNAINASKITRLTLLYAGFAFIISLVREMVKDMEDIGGDSRYNCRTFPILFGLNAAKIYSATWLIILIVLLCIMPFYVLQYGWWVSALYCILFILAPSIKILNRLFKASTSKQFHALSSAIKWVMFSGILSMIFLLLKK